MMDGRQVYPLVTYSGEVRSNSKTRRLCCVATVDALRPGEKHRVSLPKKTLEANGERLSFSLTDLAFNDLTDFPKLGFRFGADRPDFFLERRFRFSSLDLLD